MQAKLLQSAGVRKPPKHHRVGSVLAFIASLAFLRSSLASPAAADMPSCYAVFVYAR